MAVFLKIKLPYWFAVLTIALLVKFCLPAFMYEMPLGYDVGLYRYLFLQYSFVESWFSFPDLPGWTQHHSPFVLWAIGRLVHMGIPVDFFLNLGWSLAVVSCVLLYSLIIYKSNNKTIAVVSLLFLLLSFSLFKTYTFMYWKTVPAALLLVTSLYCLQKKQWLGAIIAMLLLAGSHTQTVFLLGLIIIPWWLTNLVTKEITTKTWLKMTGVLLVSAALIIATQWSMVPWALGKLTYMLDGFGLYPGAFFPIEESFFYSISIVLFGVIGFWQSLKQSKWTIWHTAIIVTLLYTCSFLYFYRRFYIQFDWLIIPFAAQGLIYCWLTYRHIAFKCIIIALLLLQFTFGNKEYFAQTFHLTPVELEALKNIEKNYKPDYPIIVLENRSPFYVQGWLPHSEVIAPDLLNRTVKGRDWSKLIFGATNEKRSVLETLPKNTKIILLPSVGRSYGKIYQERLLQNDCFKQVADTYLFSIECQ